MNSVKKHNQTAFVTFVYPNSEKYLADFINSINAQTALNFTLILFNDGILNLESKIKDLKVDFQIVNMEGTPQEIRFKALKKLSASSFDFILFQDSDDLMRTNRYKTCYDSLLKYDIVVNDLDIINENGKLIEYNYWQNRIDNNHVFTYKTIENYNFIGLGNTSIKKEVLKFLPQEPTQSLKAVDWFIFYSIMHKGNINAVFTSDTCTIYRQHQENTIGTQTAQNNKSIFIQEVKESHYKALYQSNSISEVEYIKLNNTKEVSKEIKKQNPFWWETN